MAQWVRCCPQSFPGADARAGRYRLFPIALRTRALGARVTAAFGAYDKCVTSYRLRNAQVVNQSWDNLNRLISRTYANSADNVTFSYELRGLKTQSNFARYDAAGHRTAVIWPDNVYT